MIEFLDMNYPQKDLKNTVSNHEVSKLFKVSCNFI